MDHEPHKTSAKNAAKPRGERGTTRSYVVGFLLSLVLTLVAYKLVVDHVISGDALIGTILGFAVLQMIIQIVFFLHLGREPKPYYNLAFFVGTVGLILVVVGGSIFIMHNLHSTMSPTDQTKNLVNDEGIYQINGEKTGACESKGANHRVTIKDGQVVPVQIEAAKCDTLTFINEDSDPHKMVFSGLQSDEETYAGITDVSVYNGRNKMITLSESGSYQFYDSKDAKTQGIFTVAP